MEHVDCPECLHPAKRMPVLSFINGTDDYFLCEGCKQVSYRPKDANVPLTPFKLGTLQGTEPRLAQTPLGQRSRDGFPRLRA